MHNCRLGGGWSAPNYRSDTYAFMTGVGSRPHVVRAIRSEWRHSGRIFGVNEAGARDVTCRPCRLQRCVVCRRSGHTLRCTFSRLSMPESTKFVFAHASVERPPHSKPAAPLKRCFSCGRLPGVRRRDRYPTWSDNLWQKSTVSFLRSIILPSGAIRRRYASSLAIPW